MYAIVDTPSYKPRAARIALHLTLTVPGCKGISGRVQGQGISRDLGHRERADEPPEEQDVSDACHAVACHPVAPVAREEVRIAHRCLAGLPGPRKPRGRGLQQLSGNVQGAGVPRGYRGCVRSLVWDTPVRAVRVPVLHRYR